MVDKVLEEIRRNQQKDPDRWELIKTQAEGVAAHYREVIEQKRKSRDTVIRFAAFVGNDAMYGMDDVFCLMKKSPSDGMPRS
jgi:hypothetical protein